MNILVTCSYWYYADFSYSFIHAQAKAYAAAGQRVRVLIPLPLGSRRLPEGAVQTVPGVHRLERDGVEIDYVTALSLSNFGNHRIGNYSLNDHAAIAAFRRLLPELTQDFQPDVVHAHTFGYGSEVGSWLSQRLGCPLVVTTHGGDLQAFTAAGQKDVLRSQCDSASAVVAVSAKLANEVAACGTKVPVYTVYNGFAADRVVSLPKQPHHLVQVGNLVPSKHNDYTIQAVAHLRKIYPDITLTIVGNGSERQRLELLVEKLGLTDCVFFLGTLPNAEALEEMAKAEVFVMPSYPEGFGIVYLEAMASSCVTIGTESEGIDGFIHSGENGFLVPRDDIDMIVHVIDRCFQSPALEESIAAAGRHDAKRQTWAHNAEQYIQLFNELRGN